MTKNANQSPFSVSPSTCSILKLTFLSVSRLSNVTHFLPNLLPSNSKMSLKKLLTKSLISPFKSHLLISGFLITPNPILIDFIWESWNSLNTDWTYSRPQMPIKNFHQSSTASSGVFINSSKLSLQKSSKTIMKKSSSDKYFSRLKEWSGNLSIWSSII